MKILQVQQGSDSWHAERARRFTASEAPAMMGVSKFTSRSNLLKQKATGVAPEVNAQQQAIFDRGHSTEAAARAIVEQMIGDDLFPATAVHDEDDRLLASFDGVTMTEEVIYEHKLYSEALAAQVAAGELEPHYFWQLEHQLLVSGAERAVFVCSDGTRDKFFQTEYRPVPGRREALLAGWAQFERDLAAYEPVEIRELPSAEVSLALPALFIHAKGEITTSNMKEYGAALADRLASVRAIQLVTDQDFSNAKESAKLLRENIQQAKLAKDAMLAQTVTVGEAARMIDTWCEDMRLTALKLEQDVEREDRVKKAAMIAKTKGDYQEHVDELAAQTNGIRCTLPAPDWAAAIKNKRSYASMQDALDTMAANAKIAASEQSTLIRKNREQLRPQNGVAGEDWIRLFPDFLQVCTKSADDFHNLVTARVASERQRVEAERARIRAEEEAKARATAAREQEIREAHERREREANEAEVRRVRQEVEAAERESARQAAEAAKPALPPAAAPIASPALSSQAGNVHPLPTRTPAPTQPAPRTLTLTAIAQRLGFALPAAFVADKLGVAGEKDRSAVKFSEPEFVQICAALAHHIGVVLEQHRQQRVA